MVAGERAFGAGMALPHGLGERAGLGAGLQRLAGLDLAEFVLMRHRPEPGPGSAGGFHQPRNLRLEAQHPEHHVCRAAGHGGIPGLLQPGEHDLRLVAFGAFHDRRMRRRRSMT